MEEPVQLFRRLQETPFGATAEPNVRADAATRLVAAGNWLLSAPRCDSTRTTAYAEAFACAVYADDGVRGTVARENEEASRRRKRTRPRVSNTQTFT